MDQKKLEKLWATPSIQSLVKREGTCFLLLLLFYFLLPRSLLTLFGAAYFARWIYSAWFLPIGQDVRGRRVEDRAIDASRMEPKVIIIGGSSSGLTMASELHAARIPYVVLEAETPGSSWQKRYDRLHLHTPKSGSCLKNFPFPEYFPEYISRDDLVRYYQSCSKFLNVICGAAVTQVTFDQSKSLWKVEFKDNNKGEDGVLQSPVVVVCTGQESVPSIPSFKDLHTFQGVSYHSSKYRNGAEFKGKKVLVVGFGNSGSEIALDLWEHGATPTVLVRSPLHAAPRWFTRIIGKLATWAYPLLAAGKPEDLDMIITRVLYPLCYRDLIANHKLRFHTSPGPCLNMKLTHNAPLQDLGTFDLIRKGEVLVEDKEISKFTPQGVVFKDGREVPFDAVIFATGFQKDHSPFQSFLDAKISKDSFSGKEVMESGFEVKGTRGLYFMGFSDFAGRLLQVNREASDILDDIVMKKYV